MKTEHTEALSFGTLVTHYKDLGNLAAIFMIVPTPPEHRTDSRYAKVLAQGTHVPCLHFMKYMRPVHNQKRLTPTINTEIWYLRKSELVIVKTLPNIIMYDFDFHEENSFEVLELLSPLKLQPQSQELRPFSDEEIQILNTEFDMMPDEIDDDYDITQNETIIDDTDTLQAINFAPENDFTPDKPLETVENAIDNISNDENTKNLSDETMTN